MSIWDDLHTNISQAESLYDAVVSQRDAAQDEAARLEGDLGVARNEVDRLTRALADCEAGAPPPPPPTTEVVPPGTVYVCQQVNSGQELLNMRTQIEAAYAWLTGPVGLSVRFPAERVNAALLAAILSVAGDRPVAIRPMMGRHTPDDVLAAGPWYTEGVSGGQRAPLPFTSDGSANIPFEHWYDDLCVELGEWCATHGAQLHLPWYGMDWAELAHGPGVRNAAGYSLGRFIDAHKRLVDIAHNAVPESVPLEWPLSGHGPLGTVIGDLANHMATITDGLVNGQANGWSPTNYPPRQIFGQPSATAEQQMWTAAGLPDDPIVEMGLQAIQPTAWTAPQFAQMFTAATEVHARYVEIYTPSWGTALGGAQAAVDTWRASLGA